MPKHAAQRHASHDVVIPDKLYFRIGDVAKLCGVEAYVLRFWETEFPQLRPNKSGTGQRLYRKRDVELAMRVKRLLHDEGYTIAGARQVLAQEARPGKSRTPQLPLIEGRGVAAGINQARLKRLRSDLRELLGILSTTPGHTGSSRQTSPTASKSKTRAIDSPGPKLFD